MRLRNEHKEETNSEIQKEDISTPIEKTTMQPNLPIIAEPHKRQSAGAKSPATKVHVIPSPSKLN